MLRLLAITTLLLLTLVGAMVVFVETGNAMTQPHSADPANLLAVNVITVTTTTDELNSDGDCSLREAIQAADTDSIVDGCVSGSGSDTVSLPAGLYLLTSGRIALTGTITLQGSITDTTILDGGGHDRVLHIHPGANAKLLRLEIRAGVGIPEYCPDCYGGIGEGGGVANYGRTLIADSTIHSNRAGISWSSPYDSHDASGGGVFNGGTLTIVNSTISDNAAGDGNREGNAHAGDIFCSPGGEGGGIANAGTLTLDNVTVANNKPGKNMPNNEVCAPPTYADPAIGGLYNANGASASARNSIIANNPTSDCGGSITSLGYNLIHILVGCTTSGSFIHWAAPLGPLQDNGGSTPTHALDQNNNPAIDAGSCTDSKGFSITVDQRGEPRPQGDTCDIGAYESPYTSTFTIDYTSLPLIAHQPAFCNNTVTACNLTNHPGHDNSPSWSPDGQKIVFTRSVQEYIGVGGEIYVMSADGSAPIRLNPHGYQPIWSPDGSKIAFGSIPGSNGDIFVMDADGKNPMNLTGAEASGESPAWSPDGSQILYQSTYDSNCCEFHADIFLMNADGSQKRKLATDAVLSVAPWSPDGSKIVYMDAMGNSRFHIVNVDGSNRVTFEFDGLSVSSPMWSPNGNKIAYICTYDICIMNSDGSQRLNLTNDQNAAYGPTKWSPDSRRLLFQRSYPPNNVFELAVINADGGEESRLTHSLRDSYAIDGAWSPDSRKIAFVTKMRGNLEIYVLGVED